MRRRVKRRTAPEAPAVQPASSAETRDRRSAAAARERARRTARSRSVAHALKLTQPRPRLLAGRPGAQAARADQARPAALPRAGVALHAAAPRRPAAHHDPHARRHRRPALLPEALGAGAARSSSRPSPCSRDSKDESHEYLLCNNLPTLLWLAQSGTLEFHVWHSRAQPGPDSVDARAPTTRPRSTRWKARCSNYPDYVVFDIDPYIYSGKEKRRATSPSSTRWRSRRARKWRSACASC